MLLLIRWVALPSIASGMVMFALVRACRQRQVQRFPAKEDNVNDRRPRFR